jgi:signal transduction histidine kinase
MEARRRTLRQREPGKTRDLSDERTSASEALDRALARSVALWREAARRVDRSDELGRIECLVEQIRRAAHGATPSVHTTLPGQHALEFLSSVRRFLLEETRGVDAGIRASELAAMMLGLDGVADAIAGAIKTDPLTGRIDQAASASLVVEIAHDMRSPLTSILFLVETLRKGHSGPVNAVQERQLALVYSAAFGLSAIASDVIELARGGDRLIDRTPVAFSVGELFQSVYDILLPMAEEKGLVIKLIPPASDFRVGHPSALCRVLLNLATNAVKFTSLGCVTVSAKQLSSTAIEFSVQDSGPGIPAAVMGQLYEPVRRLDAGTHSFSSAGLGLAICYRLVARMDSELKVESSPETGTRFSFEMELPLESRM